MASVRKFAKEFLSKHSKLDILINNAGVSEPGLLPDKSGFSATFTKNHLGHYLLTDLLFDVIDKTPESRVVILSSVFHQYGNTNWEEAATGRRGDLGTFDVLTHVYADSKLANLLHALDLRRRFSSNTHVFAVHPGNVRTDLWRYVYNPLHLAMDLYMRIFFLSPEYGCYTSVTAAVAPLDQLKESDGRLARFIQPYWTGGLPLVDGRAGHQIGPFAGAQVGTVSLPDNLDAELDNLREVSVKLIDFLEKRQKGEIPTDPSGEKAIHPVKATEYVNLSTDVPVRY